IYCSHGALSRCRRPDRAGRLQEFLARDSFERFDVFRRGLLDDLPRQLRRWRRLVPIERLEIIAHELLVEARWALTDDKLVFRPEARGIWSEDFIDQEQLIVDLAEFEFGIGHNDAALRRMVAAARIDFETEIFDAVRDFIAENSAAFLHVDVFVVADVVFCGRREDGLGQWRRKLQTGEQFYAAHTLRLLVLFPTGPSKITAH